MKKILTTLLLFFIFHFSMAQGTYTAANYANVGDSFFMTNATDFTTDYSVTGTNFNWNFATLTGNSQDHIQFRSPSQTGFSFLTFPYIYIPGNTNLSSTNGTSNSINTPQLAISVSDTNDYFKKTTASLKQVASSYKIGYTGLTIPVTNTYSIADIVYQFPINYGNTNTSNAAFTTTIPTLFFQQHTTDRVNTVDGWGTITTPFGTFANALRMTTDLVNNDSIALTAIGLPRIIRTTRELKWFDSSKKYPVLVVTQTGTNGVYATSNVQYMDIQRDFQSTALFTYSPLAPAAGTTVYFQNLSTNATTFNWNFGDPTSGTFNSSLLEYPTHVFAANGTYVVTLTASNGVFTNTVTQTIIISNLMGVSDFEHIQDSLYPNPFTDHITFDEVSNSSEFIMQAADGKVMCRGINITTENFTLLAKGVYVITIKSDKGIRNYKMVKQ